MIPAPVRADEASIREWDVVETGPLGKRARRDESLGRPQPKRGDSPERASGVERVRVSIGADGVQLQAGQERQSVLEVGVARTDQQRPHGAGGVLRGALGQGQIYLDYQPICSLKDRKLIGFEALVRWDHPERGLLEPATFIPVAEETGLIVPLGNWVLAEACRQMREWRTIRDSRTLQMSVNVSSLQLTHPDFVAHVATSLAAAEMSPSQLTLEVTESAVMRDPNAAVGKTVVSSQLIDRIAARLASQQR